MREIAIIGSGELGGALAYVLARRDCAALVRIIDAGQAAVGKALDITQAGAIEQFATAVVAGRDASEGGGAAVVVMAVDRPLEESLRVLNRVARSSQTSVIVCAGAGDRELVERGVRELGIARERLMGSAPEALASALRAMVALEVGGSAQDVSLAVLGVPPSQVVVPWEDAAVGGLSVARVLDVPARRRLMARVAPLWPPGPYVLAHAAAQVVSGVVGMSRRQVSVFVAPDDSGGRRARAVALPVVVGVEGIVEVKQLALTAHDRVGLDNAMLL